MGFFTPFVYRKGVVSSGGGGLPPGFDVLDGHNAIIWLDSSIGVFNDGSGTSASTGDTVYQWDDQTTYDNNAIQTDSGDRPLYTTGDTCFNGQNVLYFNRGENDKLGVIHNSSFSNLSALTLFMYFTKNDSQNFQVNDVITEFTDGPTPTSDGWGVDYQSSSSDAYLRFLYNDPAESFPSGYNELEIRTPKLDNAGPNECELYTFRVGGSGGTQPTLIEAWTGTTLVDSELGSGNGITYAGSHSDPLSIGGSSVTSNPAPLSFGNYIIYDGALSDSAVTKVQNYILSKYVTPGPTPPSGSLIIDLDPGLETWIDDGSTLATNGQDLYRWGDQSGSDNDAFCLTGATYSGLTRPAWFESGDNGKPYVHFDNFDSGQAPFYDEFMVIPNDGDFDTQEMTMFIVMRPYGPGTSRLISNSCGSSVSTYGWQAQLLGVSPYEWDVSMQSTPSGGSNFGNRPTYSANTLQIMVWRFSAGTVGQHYLQFNNETKTSGDTVTSIDYGTLSDVVINGRFSVPCESPSQSLGFYMYRLCIYDEYLDDSTVSNFITDLNNYHNIY
jgi:hypothetical protein